MGSLIKIKKMEDQDCDQKLRITLKPFSLPIDRHYVKVGDDVIKFQSEFCRKDGSHLPKDLPEHVQKVVESDIRDAVIKLCIGELDNQKRIEKAQSVIKIDKQPWHTKKRYYTAVGPEKTLHDSHVKKKQAGENASSSKSRKRKHQGLNPSAEPSDKR